MSPRSELPDFQLTVAREGERTVVAAIGELDLATVDELDATLRGELANGPVLLDLSALAFMDSTGVRVLDAIVRDLDGTLAIRSRLQPNVRQVLELTGMLAVLPFEQPALAEGGA